MPTSPEHLSIGEVAERTGRVGVGAALLRGRGHGRARPARPAVSAGSPATRCGGSRSSGSRNGSGSRSTRSASALATLPEQRTPTAADWARLSRAWKSRLDERIRLLESVRDDLSSCIGCGCLSLQACRLYNPDDRARALGQGPRYLLGDSSLDVVPELAARPRSHRRQRLTLLLDERALGGVVRERECAVVRECRFVVAVAAREQLGPRRVEQVVGVEVERRRRSRARAPGPSTSATATARLSATTGLGVIASSWS